MWFNIGLWNEAQVQCGLLYPFDRIQADCLKGIDVRIRERLSTEI